MPERPAEMSEMRRGIDLNEAVDDLYKAFAEYERPSRMVTDGRDIRASDEQGIPSKPLRCLTAEDLRMYAHKAMTTQGMVDDFRYFLPRILELCATDPAWDVDWEIVGGKIAYGQWRTWPAAEQAAIERFAWAWWASELIRDLTEDERAACDPRIHALLCALGQFLDDLRPFLDDWRGRTDRAAVWRLAALVLDVYPSFGKGKLGNAFWDGRESQMRQVMAWLLEKETVEYLEAAYLTCEHSELCHQLSDAAQQLRWLGQRSS